MVTVLLSGGMDSAVVLSLLRRRDVAVRALHLSYGQPAAATEAEAAAAVAAAAQVPFDVLVLPNQVVQRDGEFLGRNALFALVALSQMPERSGAVALGIHANCPFYDTTPAFARDLEQLLHGYTGGTVGLLTPLLHLNKAEVVALGLEHGAPLHLCWSCERSGTVACGSCLSCLDRRDLDV